MIHLKICIIWKKEKEDFYPLENLSVPGRYEIEIPKNITRTF